jgi:UDP-N-acetylglucosamine:LPS N-acetylglucosamine transferase
MAHGVEREPRRDEYPVVARHESPPAPGVPPDAAPTERAIPGHEEANAAELVRLGAAFYAPDPAALPAYVGRVLRHPSVRLGMEGAARGVGRADAAATIAALARRTRIHEAA